MARPATKELTSRQKETLQWIKEFIRKHGMPPTVREIGHAFSIKSSSVFDLLKALERKGYLQRGELGARSLIISNMKAMRTCRCEEVPVVGRIAAGQPILAVEDDRGTVTVSRALLGGRQAYALRVEGESMKEAGILEGDYAIVRKQESVDEGSIVVALIDDEATLKRFYREKNRVRLEAANRMIGPIYVDSGEFRIQGKVVAILRIIEPYTEIDK